MAAAATEAVGQEPAVTQVSLADSEPAHVNTANSFGDLESATQMCLLPHAWETQGPGIYHGVCVCAREKHVCVQARSLAELFVNALGQPSVLHKPR